METESAEETSEVSATGVLAEDFSDESAPSEAASASEEDIAVETESAEEFSEESAASEEVRALKEQIPAEIYEHKGYHCFWNPAEKKGYSGVALWSKSKPLEVNYGLGNPKFDLEGRTIVAEFKNFVLYNISGIIFAAQTSFKNSNI